MKSPTWAAGLRRAGVLERDVGRRILDLLDHLQQPLQLDLAGLRVDLGADVGLRAVARARRLLDGVLHRGDDDHAIDRLLARDRVGDLQEFQAICTDGHWSVSVPVQPGRRRFGVEPRFCLARLPLLARAASRGSSASVRTSCASPMSASGSRTVVGSFEFDALELDADASPSRPASRPRKRLRPSSGRASSILATWPAQRSKSERRTSGRSMPGRGNFEIVGAVDRVLDVERRREVARQASRNPRRSWCRPAARP